MVISHTLQTIGIIVLASALLVEFVFYQKYQKNDLILFHGKGVRDTRWKPWANAMKITIIIPLFLIWFWTRVLLLVIVWAIAFEFLTNLLGLTRDWFYVGKSSDFDKKGNAKWYVLGGFLIVIIILNIFL